MQIIKKEVLEKKEVEAGLKKIDEQLLRSITPPKPPKLDTEVVVKCIKKCLKDEGINLDLSQLRLYYDGPADETESCKGFPVYRCPTWYGGLDTDPESFTLSVYQIEKNLLCVNLIRFFMHSRYIEKELFIKTAS